LLRTFTARSLAVTAKDCSAADGAAGGWNWLTGSGGQECELVAVLGKWAEHDEELRYILDLVDTTARVLRDELEATNNAISGIIKRVIHRTFGAQPIQSP
jgi:hypothetical protein